MMQGRGHFTPTKGTLSLDVKMDRRVSEMNKEYAWKRLSMMEVTDNWLS